MPFGEELGAGVGPRTQNLKYSYLGSDKIRQRFTGYEKDDETGLDFAEARMYQNKHGRFTAPDPLLASATAPNPQTLNRYTYTGNDPVNYTDPSGLNWCRQSNGATQFTGEGVACDTANGWEDVDRSVVTITGGDWSKEKAKVGDTVILNADGTVTVNNSAEAKAIAQGQSVGEVTVDATGGNAADAAESNAGNLSAGDTSISGALFTPGLLPLPCPPELTGCGSGNVPFISLDTSHNPGLKSVEAIARIAEAGSVVPGVGTPFALIAAAVRAGQGDGWGAGGNLLNAIPLFSLLRKADKAVDATNGGIKLARELGLAGERAAGITGPKTGIKVGGTMLFPDEVTGIALREIKNVKNLSYTKQLRAYNTYAQDKGLKFILETRPGTKLTGPLKMAIANGDIIHRPILPF